MAKLSIKPLADRVVIEPAEAEQKTASGIIIPDTAKEKPQQGTVVAVGPGTKDQICWHRVPPRRQRLYDYARKRCNCNHLILL